MGFPVRLCALVGRFSDPRVAESVSVLIPHLLSRQVKVIVSEETPFSGDAAGILRMPEKDIGTQADLVIAIGGDGTLLYAAGLVARFKVPLLGVNRGRLGFLTDVMPQNMFPCIDAALEGRLQADERPLLAACMTYASGRVSEGLALNDVVMQKVVTGRMLDFETSLGGTYVNTHAGDGLVVATPTGSTAYALSCGGPIVEPNLDVLVVAPICPHTLSDRPIVVSARSEVHVKLLERPDDTRAEVTCDGTVLGALEPGDRLTIKAATEKISLLHPAGYDYYALLRSKLHWGRGSFER